MTVYGTGREFSLPVLNLFEKIVAYGRNYDKMNMCAKIVQTMGDIVNVERSSRTSGAHISINQSKFLGGNKNGKQMGLHLRRR